MNADPPKAAERSLADVLSEYVDTDTGNEAPPLGFRSPA